MNVTIVIKQIKVANNVIDGEREVNEKTMMSKETKLNQIRLTLKKIVVWYFYGDEEDRRETEPVNFIFTITYHIPLHKIIFMTHPIGPSQVK